MYKVLLIFVLLATLLGCSEATTDSKNPFAKYFFPYSKESKFYVYRDVVHGLNEKFYRVYGLEDSKGKHIVVETYAMDGRITEALNYNLDSLTILDHMVVDRKGMQTKALMMKNGMFPMDEKENTWFASKFPGFLDSTLILSETKRSILKSKPYLTKVMEESKNTIITLDTIRFTMFNPFRKTENQQMIRVKSYFAEGLGLVRFHDVNMKTDYRLEKILTQEEWVRLMQK
ncbi:MAG: hypothetical protein ACK5B9_00355 [Flavobacteriia bacterium]|jgi:hypothetical protein